MSTKAYCVAGILAALLGAGPAAAQQSLALSYDLAPRSGPAQEAPAAIGRCAGFNWLTAIEACGRDLVARIVPARGEPVQAPSTSELPELGSPAPERYVRSSGGRDAPVGNSKAPAPDLLLRLGSKVRMKSNDEGNWEYRFTDVNYESHVRNNAMKAVGVELLVPFQ